jgi:hypothetical protein
MSSSDEAPARRLGNESQRVKNLIAPATSKNVELGWLICWWNIPNIA